MLKVFTCLARVANNCINLFIYSKESTWLLHTVLLAGKDFSDEVVLLFVVFVPTSCQNLIKFDCLLLFNIERIKNKY